MNNRFPNALIKTKISNKRYVSSKLSFVEVE